MSAAQRLLTDELIERIRGYFPRYPDRRAVVLPALHAVNEQLGYVPREAVVEIAELLGLAPAEVQDTLSFYGFFKQDAPAGQVRVWVCRSLSCAARGGEELLEYLCRKLGIRPGQTTPDGRVTLEYAECLGACDFAPAALAGDVLLKNLTREKIDQWVEAIPSRKNQGTNHA
ncbi:MAG: NAD(P)H-dependent oxidoreductase subunit E [Thermoguttaceae bacterium]|jgi:NADH-quinone oxidoreductase subunit E|nr:NAD(P)H-dependent oxidoreductase subunit E [Thermoguttaceae bacterium]